MTLLLKSNILGFKELMSRLNEKDGGSKNGAQKNIPHGKNSLPLVVPVKTPRTIKGPGKWIFKVASFKLKFSKIKHDGQTIDDPKGE